MLQNLITVILVIAIALTLALFFRNYTPFRPGANESVENSASQRGMSSGSYKNSNIYDLSEELAILCEESKFEGLGSLVKAIKDRADLVIIGRIGSVSIKQKFSGSSDEEMRYYLSVSVESVERGSCPHDAIQAYVGYYASWSASGFYPAGLKTNYKSGDRARIFINFIPGESDPVVTAGFFGMEPILP